MRKSEALVARLVELRQSGHVASDVERQRYAQLPEKTLERMVASLEAGAKLAAEMRTVAKGDEQARENIRSRKEKALAGLDAVADRIAARKALPALQQAQQVVYANKALPGAPIDDEAHLAAILHLFENPYDRSILWALRMRSVLDEYTENWRRSAVDRFADLIIESEPGNLIMAIEMKFANRPVATLAKIDIVENYLEFALQKTSSGVLRLLDKRLQAGAGRDPAVKRLLAEYARTAPFEPIFLTDPNPVLTAAAATEALAKLYLFGSEFKPTRIVSVGSGSEMVGRFLRSEMRNDRPHLHHFRGAVSEAVRATSADDRVLIVSDVATATRDLERLQEALAAYLPASSIAFAALAGRASTYDMVRASHLAFIVNLTTQHDVKLPWGRAGSYRRTAASHFFGHDGPHPLRIAKDFFLSVTHGIMALVR